MTTIFVPSNHIGSVIGKNGSYIKDVERLSNAKVYYSFQLSIFNFQ